MIKKTSKYSHLRSWIWGIFAINTADLLSFFTSCTSLRTGIMELMIRSTTRSWVRGSDHPVKPKLKVLNFKNPLELLNPNTKTAKECKEYKLPFWGDVQTYDVDVDWWHEVRKFLQYRPGGLLLALSVHIPVILSEPCPSLYVTMAPLTEGVSARCAISVQCTCFKKKTAASVPSSNMNHLFGHRARRKETIMNLVQLLQTRKKSSASYYVLGMMGGIQWCSYHKEPLETLTSSACGTSSQSMVFWPMCFIVWEL